MVTELMQGVYWVGAVDWDLRHFHGHELSTHRGSTYNAYLIVDEVICAFGRLGRWFGSERYGVRP
jgi:flavorubredoxin